MGIERFIAVFGASLTIVGLNAEPSIVISEFMADNTRTLADVDGDFSDWIELANHSSESQDLAGWRLTDDPKLRATWSLPSTNIPPGGYVLIFASGKDRAVAGQELHADFRLAAKGEFLALLAPDGGVASAFSPAFPPQWPDIAFGLGRSVTSETVVSLNASMRAYVPTNNVLGLRWTGDRAAEPFDDSPAAGWIAGTSGAGFDTASGPDPLGPMGYWDFNTAAEPNRARDVSGRGHDGTISGAKFTADSGGYSGKPGDRALDFGNGVGRVRILDAASGTFDSATRSNALSVSLWIYGGAGQPAPTTAFWFWENADGSGARSAQAHLPWSDQVIYWDTGNGSDCCSPAGRISKLEPDASKWKGRWNHYVFLKRGPEKEIWQNGALFLRGDGSYPLARLRSLTLGALPDGSSGYVGMIDDFALWDRALTGDEIRALAAGASPMALAGFSSLIGTDLGALMQGVNTSVYLRLPFSLTAAPDFDSLQLRIQYNAGFVAYLNGVEVARRNAPDIAWNGAAVRGRSRSEALRFEAIDLVAAAEGLHVGENVLAVHGQNNRLDDASFLVRPELVGLKLAPGRFLPNPTPGSPNSSGFLGFVTKPELSLPHGFYSEPMDLVIRSTTPGATLVYTTNGSLPQLTNGFVIQPDDPNATAITTVMLRSTTVLRAAAFRPDYRASPAATETFLFSEAIAHQPARPSGLPTTWADGSRADYEVDPEVVNRTLPGFDFSAALAALPCLSLVADPIDFWDRSQGIYANPIPRGDAWERPASAEFVFADGRPGFQIDCGVHIHGNISRQNDFTPKHSFRLVFKATYGPTDLEYPLFGPTGVQKFDEIVLKGLSTDSWPCVEWGPNGEGFVRWLRKDASYIRDQWVRDSYSAMGQVGCRGRFVHLFLNGLYWGVYNLNEHPSASFQAANYGGGRDEYDALKDFTELDSGDLTAWDAMMSLAGSGLASEAAYQRLQGNNPDGTRNAAYEWYLNVDNLIDYMVLHIAIGADDWPNHNWWGGRRRGAESEGFRFFPWDQEISVNSLQRTQTSWGGRYEDVDVPGTPTYLYARLRVNANFRLRFADHVQRHFFSGGALSPSANDARWQARVQELDQAIVAESARWGDSQRAVPYRREVEWLNDNRWMQTEFWPKNQNLALARFRRAGLFPAVAAPLFSQPGGVIAPGAPISITAVAGTIYATTDGSDPRRPNGTIASAALSNPTTPNRLEISLTESRRLKARVLSGSTWSALTEAVFVVPLSFPLAVTELMFNPPTQTATERARAGGRVFAADEYEFIELQNLSGDRPLNLAGLNFTAGIRFIFGTVILQPMERVVLVRNRAAFANRYSESVRVVGEYGNAVDSGLDSQLANGGERLELVDSVGNVIVSFTYDDNWYAASDGAGYALELVDAANDPNRAESWRAGSVFGGTPGLSSWPSVTIHSVELAPEGVRLVFETEPGQTVRVEQTTSLAGPAWSTVYVAPMHPTHQTVTYTIPIGDAAGGFYRLVD